MDLQLTDETLAELEQISESGDPPPWTAMVEGRDHSSGDSFIQVGRHDDRDEDMYVTRDSGPAQARDLDLIAAARNYLPVLVREVKRLRGLVHEEP